MTLKAPFPYFGGKAQVADRVWGALGQPTHYIEPFFGSGAVLLARPGYDAVRHMETVCDLDGFVCNVWRALATCPDKLAEACDWPVNHADLMARKKALLRKKDGLLAALVEDEKYCDAELAGYWVWAASCWIGSGMMCPTQIPHLGNAGMGVHNASMTGQIPHLSNAGMGVHKASMTGQIPHLGNAGMGVHKASMAGQSDMCNSIIPRNAMLYAWFAALACRLRTVRVVCGDWSRVCGGDWQADLGICGIFFDPPHSAEADRDMNLYDRDSGTVAHEVRAWCLERGGRADYRIVLAGYEGEGHEELESHGWRVKAWKAKGGYGHLSGTEAPGEQCNWHRERLWLSPHCRAEMPLFRRVTEPDDSAA